MNSHLTNKNKFLEMQNSLFFIILLIAEVAFVIGSIIIIPRGSINYPFYVVVISMFMGFALILATVLIHYMSRNENRKQLLFSGVAFIVYLFSNVFYLRMLGTVSSFIWFGLFIAIYTTQNRKLIISFCGLAIVYYFITMIWLDDVGIIIVGTGYYLNRYISITGIGVISLFSLKVFNHYDQMIYGQIKELDHKNTELKMLNVEVRDTKSILEDQYSKVYQLAYYDQLTGLGNRSNYNDFLTKYTEVGFGIILVDIINMKFINDTYSHQTGDIILKVVSKQLMDFFSEDVFIARLGGDEFAIVITNKVELEVIAEQLIILFTKTIQAGDLEIVVNVNIGLLDNFNASMTKNEALKNSDLAMVHSKSLKLRHSHYIKYAPAMSEEAYEQFFISIELSKAIENHDIYVVYQPKYNTYSNKIVGFEALVRWEHETLGYVRPDIFVKIAEQHGLIESLTDIVIRESCQFAKKINFGMRRDPLLVTVNISGVQLMKDDFYQRMVGTLFSENTDTSYIGIEITETAVMESLHDVLGNLNRLRSNNIRISLDDFGTGYSSLNYLRSLPIDTLKIDKSFVDHVCHNQKDEYMIRMIIDLAKYLDIHLVAEGVEEEEQYQMLRSLGCDTIQGYYFSKPLKYNDAVLLVKTE